LDLFRYNSLADPGTLEILGTPIDLRKVTCDAYVVAGSTDHIVPWTGAYQTTQLLGGQCQFVLSSSGHIQAIVNPPTNAKASYLTRPEPLPPSASEWLESAVRHAGSWWENWTDWLIARSGEERPSAGTLGSVAHPPIEPAPGRYVRLS
jgi:polyhydroxyalkanoate synthase